jgi:hypothetical protein
MTRERIEDFDDVERLNRNPDYERVRPKKVNADEHVGPRPVHAIAGTGMNGVEVDLAQLALAERELAGLHDQLVAHMNKATALTEPVRDGNSPIVAHMRRAFLERADLAGGVQGTLQDYLKELFAVRGAILATLSSYQALDADAAALLDRHTAELAEEED